MCGYLAVLVGSLGEGASNDCGIVDTVTDHLRYLRSGHGMSCHSECF